MQKILFLAVAVTLFVSQQAYANQKAGEVAASKLVAHSMVVMDPQMTPSQIDESATQFVLLTHQLGKAGGRQANVTLGITKNPAEKQVAKTILEAEWRLDKEAARITVEEFEKGRLTKEKWDKRCSYFVNFWQSTYLLGKDTNEAYSRGHQLEMIERKMGWKSNCAPPLYQIVTPLGVYDFSSNPNTGEQAVVEYVRTNLK